MLVWIIIIFRAPGHVQFGAMEKHKKSSSINMIRKTFAALFILLSGGLLPAQSMTLNEIALIDSADTYISIPGNPILWGSDGDLHVFYSVGVLLIPFSTGVRQTPAVHGLHRRWWP